MDRNNFHYNPEPPEMTEGTVPEIRIRLYLDTDTDHGQIEELIVRLGRFLEEEGFGNSKYLTNFISLHAVDDTTGDAREFVQELIADESLVQVYVKQEEPIGEISN